MQESQMSQFEPLSPVNLDVFRSTKNELIDRKFMNSPGYMARKILEENGQHENLEAFNRQPEIYLNIITEEKNQLLGEKISKTLTSIFGKGDEQFNIFGSSSEDVSYLKDFFGVLKKIFEKSIRTEIGFGSVFLKKFNRVDLLRLMILSSDDHFCNSQVLTYKISEIMRNVRR